MISPKDVALEFEKRGFVLIEPSKQCFRRKCGSLKDGFVSSKENFRTAFANEGGTPRHLINILRSDNKNSILDILKDSSIFEVVNEIFMEIDLEFTHSKISFKTVGANSDWLSHQDNGYRLANGNKPRAGLAMMVFLEDVTVKDGPLEVIPYSHKNGTLEHKRIWASSEKVDYQLGLDGLPDHSFTKITGSVGSVLLFHNDTIHRSGASTRSSRYCMIVELRHSDHKSLDYYGLPPFPYNYSPGWIEIISKNIRSLFNTGRIWMIVKRSKSLTKWVRRIAFR